MPDKTSQQEKIGDKNNKLRKIFQISIAVKTIDLGWSNAIYHKVY